MTGVPTEEAIDAWLAEYVGELLSVPAEEVDRDASFESLGLDSASAVAITGDLEEWLGVELDPNDAYAYPTIHSLRRYLAVLAASKRTAS